MGAGREQFHPAVPLVESSRKSSQGMSRNAPVPLRFRYAAPMGERNAVDQYASLATKENP